MPSTAPVRAAVKVCKNCFTPGRPAPHPGPRCATCWRLEKKRRKLAKAEYKVQRTYDITAEEYDALYAAQGGRCAICRVASGKTRRLAVDHDHQTGVIRGLLCSVCNHKLLGRYGREKLVRAVDYLDNPPAVRVLGIRLVTSNTPPVA